MALYEEKCAKRLCELIEAKIKEVQSNRDKLNAEIEEKNKANQKRAKAIGNPTSKVVLRKKFSPFTKKELLPCTRTGLHGSRVGLPMPLGNALNPQARGVRASLPAPTPNWA